MVGVRLRERHARDLAHLIEQRGGSVRAPYRPSAVSRMDLGAYRFTGTFRYVPSWSDAAIANERA